MPKPMTPRRRNALMEAARRGQEEVLYYWQDNFEVDISQPDGPQLTKEIRAAKQWDGFDRAECRQAIANYRYANEALKILEERH